MKLSFVILNHNTLSFDVLRIVDAFQYDIGYL
jgi:hypothetical protein